MTDEERKMLHDLHDAFMKPPLAGGDPLIKRISGVVVVAERSSWATKWGIRIFIGLGTIAAATASLRGYWR